MRTFRLRLGLVLGLVVAGGFPAEAQSDGPGLGFAATPYVSLPLGRDAQVFQAGGGAEATASYLFNRTPLSASALVDLAWAPTSDPATSLTIVGLGARAGFLWPLTPTFSLGAQTAAGGFYARLNDASGTGGLNPWYQAGVELRWALGGPWYLGAQADYRSRLGLVSDARLALSLGTGPSAPTTPVIRFQVPPGFTPLLKEQRGLKVAALQADPIFPVFSKYYDTHRLARVILHNYETVPVDQIALSLEVKGYMDGPRDLKVPLRMGPGEDATVDLLALFNDRLLTVAETTKASLTLTLSYTQAGQSALETYSPSVVLEHRNGMTWDDDRHVAAFVSSRDPAAFGFGRGVMASTRDAVNPAVSPEIQTASALHAALRQLGLVYVKDPNSAFNTGKTAAVDSLQYPQETLSSRSGDCDDLTILWCSLLESVGIETAALTVPGHIFLAFALGTPPQDALSLWGSDADFLLKDGKVWVPLEATVIKEGFLEAWKTGAREVRDQRADLNFLPLREAWQSFPPVVMSGTAAAPPLPPAATLNGEVKATLASYIQQQLKPRADKLATELKAATPTQAPRVENKLGILYARYGQYPAAFEIFKKLAAKNYRPALDNLGNAYLLTGQPKAAVESFQAALKLQAGDKTALAGLVLAFNDLGDQPQWKVAVDRLAKVDQDKAVQLGAVALASSDNGNRADNVASRQGQVSWNE